MKNRLAGLLFAWCLSAFASAASVIDPIADYLRGDNPNAYSDNTIRKDSYYSDFRVFRADLDLNNDGRREVLVSSTKDSDGKQGNVWAVYANTQAGYTKIGTMTFSPNSFYLGPIEDFGDYGLVTFKPTGEGEGMLSAYLFSGMVVRDVAITSVTRDSPTVDSDTGRPMGQAIVDKYMNQAANAADAITSTNAATLAKQYGLRIAGDQQTQSSPFSAPSSPDSSSSSEAVQSSSPSSKAEASRLIPWTLLIVILALVTVGTVVWVKRG
jgi:hypothetical protein